MAALTCAGAGAAAPLSGSRRSRRNPSLRPGGHGARARGTAGQAVPEGCWHLPRRCRRWPEAHAGPRGAMASGSPSHGRAERRERPLPGHGGGSGLCHVPRRPRSGASDAQGHPGTHRAARPAALPVLRGCEQGPGMASPAPGLRQGGPRHRASPAVLQRPWEAAAPWHRTVPVSRWGKVSPGAGGVRQGLTGASAVWKGLEGSGRVRQPSTPTEGEKLCRRGAAAPRGSSHRQSSRSL